MSPVRVIAAGLWSALGPTLDATRVTLTGKGGMRRQRSFLGADYKPLLTAFDHDLTDEAAPDRMRHIAAQALADLDTSALPDGPISLAVLLPELSAAEGLDPDTLTKLGRDLAHMAADILDRPISKSTLHLDGAPALAAALANHMTSDERSTILALAVDSLACRRRLIARLAGDRTGLFSDATPWGPIPGEGSAAILLGAGAAQSPRVAGIALEQEPVGEFDMGDSDYDGLTRACWAALPQDTAPVTRWLTDWNNGRYRAAELSYVQMRISERLKDGVLPDHPALRFGDTGAAGPAMAIALHANDPGRLLLTCGAPGSNLRAALVVDTPTPT
ncbi:hypothetical protein KUV51_02875 [Tateyamaria omphalii]|uniref:hypothetical protein n=1 Tax=Tateyamaria omphalii TaxID=299262 RepID=UPI001C993EDE|nr:hypothetical protein [Tateyamaria omphalii]MBY5931933.1 hypothetical protein [Tateyamaria omphalii]